MLNNSTALGQMPDRTIRGYLHQYGAVLVFLVGLLDVAIIVGCFIGSLSVSGQTFGKDQLIVLLTVLVVFLACTIAHSFYRAHRMTGILRESLHLVFFWVISVGVMNTLLVVFEPYLELRREPIALWIVSAGLGLVLSRVVLRSIAHQLRKAGRNIRYAAIVGATDSGFRIYQGMSANRWMGFVFSGFFDARGRERCAEDSRFEELRIEGLDVLFEKIQRGEVHVVFIALPMRAQQRIATLVEDLCTTSVSTYYVPDFESFGLLHARMGSLAGQPVVSIVETPFIGDLDILKRSEDLLLATIALLVVAMPMLAIALLVRLGSPGPVLYRQKRYGLDGRPFMIYKFRTMYSRQDDAPFRQATRNDPRVTPIGRLLRKYSLDELPQLFNVLQGRMSLIGPRPHPIALDDEHKLLIQRYNVRFKVKPGITGWAQVNGYRGETDTLDKMEGRIRLDLQYIANWSIFFDLKILLMTVFSVVRARNAF